MIGSLILLATGAAVVVVSAAAIGALAYVYAKRRSPVLFVVAVAVFWVGAACVLGYYSSVTTFAPNRISVWRHMAASFVAIAPLVVIPAALTLLPVINGATVRRILLLATAGAVVALPVAFFTGIASSCYVAHDCP